MSETLTVAAPPSPVTHPPRGRLLRWAAILELVGLFFESIALLKLTPGTFVLFLMLGAPLIALGMFLFACHVVRVLRARGAI